VTYEKSKAMVEYVKAVTEELKEDSLPESGNESLKRGGQPRAASQEKVSERTGVSPATARRAAVHVEVAGAFPFMQPWSQ